MSLIIVLVCVASIEVDTISSVSIEEIKKAYEVLLEKKELLFKNDSVTYKPISLERETLHMLSNQGVKFPEPPKKNQDFFRQKFFVLFDEKRKVLNGQFSVVSSKPPCFPLKSKDVFSRKHVRQKR
ncbi:MAG: hypothetical protein EOM85_02035 [Candidatus Moranbacteria bacterium]|nr:hypothetical protein [Candidatus Moranbacteria bacterium]